MRDRPRNVDKGMPANSASNLEVQDAQEFAERARLVMRVQELEEVHGQVHDKSISRRAHPRYSHGFRNGVERSLAIMQAREANFTDGPDENADESLSELTGLEPDAQEFAERLAQLEKIHALPTEGQMFQDGLERALSIMQGREPKYGSDTAEAELSDIAKKITNIRDLRGAECRVEAGEYKRGMYNGLELALSIVQSHNPEYKGEPVQTAECECEEELKSLLGMSENGPSPEQAEVELDARTAKIFRSFNYYKSEESERAWHTAGLRNGIELALSLVQKRYPWYRIRA